jgi:hypothetical protein
MVLRKSLETANVQNAEFSNLKLLKFAYTLCTVGLSTRNLEPRGVSYITVTKITDVHINTAYQKLDITTYSLFQILQCLVHFSPNTAQLLLKTCHLSTNTKFSVHHLN